MNQTARTPFRLTIGVKLIALIGGLLMASLATVVWIATQLFIEDNTALIQQMNADMAGSLATRTQSYLGGLAEKARIVGLGLNTSQTGKVVSEVFDKDEALLGVGVVQIGHTTRQIASPSLDARVSGGSSKFLSDFMNGRKDVAKGVADTGIADLAAIPMDDGRAILALTAPFIESSAAPGRFTHVLVVLADPTPLVGSFTASPLFTSFLVDSHGKLLVHPDWQRVIAGESVSHLKIVEQMLSGQFGNGQTRYEDPESKKYQLGAFRLVGLAGLGVVTEVSEAKAREAADRVRYRSFLAGVIILCLAFFGGYYYSETLTYPIRLLMEASRKIAQGDFKIALKAKSRDELGHLSLAFNEMAKGLEERDKVKATFNKFHNKEIAEKLLSGEVKLGGERKNATVFFSDVRGFTGLSEKMEPEAVVEMINEYMTRMVSVIRKHGGVVDKYVGDAIMALWGVPLARPDDAVNSVRACIEMRQELAKLNEVRLARGEPALKIGMGLNLGPLVAGNIGSDERMEYTVIGDAVNLASRIESMTKEYGTDLLISQNVTDSIGDAFILEEVESVKVKGKSEPVRIFMVRGYKDSEGREVIVETDYSTYAKEKSDKRAA